MPWKIVEQEEVYGKNRVPVKCKRLRYFPIDGGGGNVTFGKLKFPLFQVIVEDETGEQIKLKLNASDGVKYPKFVVKHPDKEAYPEMWVGEGRRRRKVEDTLSKKVRVPGHKEEYDAKGMESRLVGMTGKPLADEVMTLFARKIASVAA